MYVIAICIIFIYSIKEKGCDSLVIILGAYLTLFLNYKPFQGSPSLGQKNLMRADHNCKCHAPGTDDFTSPQKDTVQGARTHLV